MRRLGAYRGRRLALGRPDGLGKHQAGAEDAVYPYCLDEGRSIGILRALKPPKTSVKRRAQPDIPAPLPPTVQPAR
jgi:hypothetical protein